MSRATMEGKQALGAGMLLLAGSLLSACGESDADTATAQAYQQLYRAGYFPNPDLAARFPEWRPIVRQLPSSPEIIDAPFALAISKFQKNMGLPISGIPDAETLARMNERSCGNPDSDPDLPPRRSKFLNYDFPWTQTIITYRFASTGELPGITTAGASRANARTGLNKWTTATNLTFNEVSAGENVRIQWGDAAGYVGLQTWEGDTAVITLDSTSGVPWTTTEIQQVTAHEWGHALTLDHSALTTAVMYPFANQSAFADDDVLLANTLYNTWESIPGAAWDIAITPKTNGTDGVWVIGADARQVYEWNASSSSWTPRGAPLGTPAYILTVDKNNRPWVADSANVIRTWNGTTWVTKSGTAVSIAAGPSGKIYRCDPNGTVALLNSAQTAWTSIGAPSGRLIWSIATDRVGNVFGLSQSVYEIWKYSGGSWSQASAANPVSYDVASGGGTTALTYTWSIGGDEQPHIWAKQDAANVGSGIFAGDVWLQAPLPVPAYTLASGVHGRAWVVDVNGGIWRRREVQ